jgi:hypothetical protein
LVEASAAAAGVVDVSILEDAAAPNALPRRVLLAILRGLAPPLLPSSVIAAAASPISSQSRYLSLQFALREIGAADVVLSSRRPLSAVDDSAKAILNFFFSFSFPFFFFFS